jgi:hypothetical protein
MSLNMTHKLTHRTVIKCTNATHMRIARKHTDRIRLEWEYKARER